MNVLQGVILTAMRLATLIWLTGAVCCMPVLAADPQHKERSAAEKAPQPRSRNVSLQCIAPAPGLPVPMDLTQADEIRLYQTSFVMASLVPWIREENMYAIE